MASPRSILTSVMLFGLLPALACNPGTEETATDSDGPTTSDAPTSSTSSDTSTGDSDASSGDTGSSGDTAPTSGADTDPGADTEADTEADTDTGVDACPEPDPSLELLNISEWESAQGGDCTVQDASNAGGQVALDLLCGGEPVAIDITVPADFKVDVAGLLDVKLTVTTDDLLEGISFVVNDLKTGDLVLAAHQMNGLLSPAALAPFSLAHTASCGGDACIDTSQITFTHADGPSLALFPGSRDSLSSGGRNFDIIVRSAWEDLCQEHVGNYTWVIGASISE